MVVQYLLSSINLQILLSFTQDDGCGEAAPEDRRHEGAHSGPGREEREAHQQLQEAQGSHHQRHHIRICVHHCFPYHYVRLQLRFCKETCIKLTTMSSRSNQISSS